MPTRKGRSLVANLRSIVGRHSDKVVSIEAGSGPRAARRRSIFDLIDAKGTIRMRCIPE